jgi:hypothetical protein
LVKPDLRNAMHSALDRQKGREASELDSIETSDMRGFGRLT